MSRVPVLFELLKSRNISQTKLSNNLGISQGNISDWKSGRSSPTKDNLLKLSEYFNVSTDYLLGKTENPAAVDGSEVWNKICNDEKKLMLASWIAELNNEQLETVVTLLNAAKSLPE